MAIYVVATYIVMRAVCISQTCEYNIAVICKDALDDFCTVDKGFSGLTKSLIGGIFFWAIHLQA
jgi:hypothetical protein